ncbi:hypothetical protein NRB20_06220 [Nocardia sp. RB20]|uniref:Uncharacterized protein n=1 Tax=Nocardia macrotermitis TaxID=2585198 RepID=A0A7K0CVU5_9NOCA|nr:hypothetical protein [Nocardia macrotermitis]
MLAQRVELMQYPPGHTSRALFDLSKTDTSKSARSNAHGQPAAYAETGIPIYLLIDREAAAVSGHREHVVDQTARVVLVGGQAEDDVVVHRCDDVIQDLLLGRDPFPARSCAVQHRLGL